MEWVILYWSWKRYFYYLRLENLSLGRWSDLFGFRDLVVELVYKDEIFKL